MQEKEEDNSCYSNDEEYFLDVCRAGELEELKEFVTSLNEETPFDWACISNSQDNFLHMLAANNLTQLFQFLFPIVAKKLPSDKLSELVNKQNNTGNTPLHYAVITESKEMLLKLLEIGVDLTLVNESNRTAYAEAEEFDKFEMAEIIAPLMRNNLAEMKKEFQAMDICNEDDEQDEEHEPVEEKPEQSREMADQE